MKWSALARLSQWSCISWQRRMLRRFGTVLTLVFAVFLVGINLGQPIFPPCPSDLRFHCKILENAWMQPPRTLAVIGGDVCREIDPDHTNQETRNFIAAVKAYDKAERNLSTDPSDLNAISQLDRARMDLVLAAKSLRSIVGALSI